MQQPANPRIVLDLGMNLAAVRIEHAHGEGVRRPLITAAAASRNWIRY